MSEQHKKQDTDFFSDTDELSLDFLQAQKSDEEALEFIQNRQLEAIDPVTRATYTVPAEIARCIAENIFHVPGSIDRSNPAHIAIVHAIQEEGIPIPECATNPDAKPDSYYRDVTAIQPPRAAEV